METPKSGRPERGKRIPTPRLSERKKQLFRSRSHNLNKIDDDNDVDDPLLSGIAPLSPASVVIDSKAGKGVSSLHRLLNDIEQQSHSNDNAKRLRSYSNSPENNKENKRRLRTSVGGGPVGVVTTTDEQLPHLFTKTMRINSNSSGGSVSPRTPKKRRAMRLSTDNDNSDNEGEAGRVQAKTKRAHTLTAASSPESTSGSPQSKQRKIHKQCIPTMAFYSHGGATTSPKSVQKKSKEIKTQQPKRQQQSAKLKTTSPTQLRLGINKGVKHKIRRPMRQTAHSLPPTNVDVILRSLRNEKLRNLIINKREERAKVQEVHEILRCAMDPIKMAKPLSIIAGDDDNNNNENSSLAHDKWQLSADFSDLSEEEDMKDEAAATSLDIEPIIPLIRHDILNASPDKQNVPNETSKRKFFKSGRKSTCMEVKITDNIRASLVHGKLALVEAPPRKVRRVRVKSATKFAIEQATVDAILRNLDETVVGDVIESEAPAICNEPVPAAAAAVIEPVVLEDPYAKYRKLLPYNTDDAAIIEQQELLLEFLISNDICTDENFKIFIAEPDNHKEQATRIVDEMYMIVNAEQLMNEIEMETAPADADNATKQQLEIPEPAMPAGPQPESKLFPIFTQNLQPLPQKSKRRLTAGTARLLAGATGANQYQIDAGQKAYGAKQCQQCGLVYTVHEPEEEQLHREYHNSIHVLRFKGWIDEDIVAVHSEWAHDGRIIRINELAPSARLERLAEIIKVVDKELGYASYIVPKTFVAFFAVRKQQIVGMCLVQPLTQAHRIVRIDNTDYLSEQLYEASCGVSRIWVAPLQRRQGIAKKLIRAVQRHTILGQEIPLDGIAFSAPTDDGYAFARYVTQCDNFLTYQ